MPSTIVASTSTGATGVPERRIEIKAPPLDRAALLWTAVLTIGTFTGITLLANIPLLVNRPLQPWVDLGFFLSISLPPLIAGFGIYLSTREWRDAITAAFVVAYVLILMTTFGLGLGINVAAPESLRRVVLDNFTGLMGVVVAFYFGSEAAVEVSKLLVASRVTNTAAGTTPDDTAASGT